jgi:septal ring factor EnvC (AmiA/AmiB activator)
MRLHPCLTMKDMKTHLEQRLKELKAEYETGQKMLAELENKMQNLKDTLLRISGAIQVIEQEIAQANSQEHAIRKPTE